MAPSPTISRYRRCRSYDSYNGRPRRSFHRRLSLNTFHDPSERDQLSHSLFSRPLLPRNPIRYGHCEFVSSYSSNEDLLREAQSNGKRTGSGRWRDIVWNALRKSARNIGNEFVNVVTANIVEFGVAVVTAYVSNYFWT